MSGHKKHFFIIIVLILPVLIYSQPVHTLTRLWRNRYAEQSGIQPHEYPAGLAVDNNGNVYVTMSARDGEHCKYTTIKISPYGSLEWAKFVQSSWGFAEPSGLAIDGDEIYVTGYYRYGYGTWRDYYTVLYNDDGDEVKYVNHGEDDHDYAKAIAIDDDYVYVTGYVDVDPSDQAQDHAFRTYKYSRYYLNLCPGWPQTYNPSSDDDEACAIAVHNGIVYVTGRSWENANEDSKWDWLTISYAADGSLRWAKTYNAADYDDEPKAIAVDNSGEVYVTGYRELASNFNKDYYTISYDSDDGESRWEKYYNGTDNRKDIAYAIALDEVGRVYVTGCSRGEDSLENILTIGYYTSDGGDYWLLPLSYDENLDRDSAMAIAVEKDGSRIYVTGEVTPSDEGDDGDYVTLVYNSSGILEYRGRYDCEDDNQGNEVSKEDYPVAIAIDNNSIYVTGSSMGDDFYDEHFDCLTIKYGKPTNVGITSIESPVGTVDSGVVVTPACSVYNFGSDTQNYRIRMKIGNNVYNETSYVSNHVPYTIRYVEFPSYSAWPRGTHAVNCTTELTGDINKSNDRCTTSIYAQVFDVGCTKLIAPIGQMGIGGSVTPACSVYNFGNQTVDNYKTYMEIRGWQGPSIVIVYKDSVTVSNHSPGSYNYLEFTPWTPEETGEYYVSAYTALTNDANGGNNAQDDKINVLEIYFDVGCTKILAPIGTIDSTANITPACSVHNNGNQNADYEVRMKIDDFYEEAFNVSGHEPWTYQYVEFPEYSTWPRETHTVKCSTEFAEDMNNSNDKKTGSFSVRVLDVGCTKIIAPVGQIEMMSKVTPACSVYNFGNERVIFYEVRMTIEFERQGIVYEALDSVYDHDIGTLEYVDFTEWIPEHTGIFYVTATTLLSGDMNPINDEKLDSVEVVESDFIEMGDNQMEEKTIKIVSDAIKIPTYTIYNSEAGDGYTIEINRSVFNDPVSIKVYNVFGHLVQSQKTDKGIITIKGLPAGIYILRLDAKGYSTIRKLLVIK